MTSEDRKPPQIPLRVVITLPMIGLILLSVGLTWYFSYLNGQKTLDRLVTQIQAQIAAQIEQHLRDFLRTPHTINQLNANAISQGILDVGAAADLERHFFEQIQVFDSVTSIYFGNSQGGLVDAGREGAEGSLYVILTEDFVSGPFNKFAVDDQGTHTELLASLPDFDARTRPWYLDALEKGEATWGEVYLLFTGQDMALSASQPVYDQNGNLLGVLSSDIFTSHLGNFLEDLEISRNGLAFIMERDGHLVASSTGEAPFTQAGEDETARRLLAQESAIATVRLTAESLLDQFGGYAAISKERALEFEIEGRRHFVRVLPVRDDYGIDWLVIILVPESDFTAQMVLNNRLTASLIVVAAFGAVFISVILAGRFSDSLTHLVHSTQALAEGASPSPVRISRIREMGVLAQAFNRMAGRLTQTLSDLRDEVETRRQAEKNLSESERRFREMLETVELIAVMLDPDGNITFCNDFMLELTGWEQEEIIGASWFENFIPPEIRNGLQKEVFLEAFRSGDLKPHHINEIMTRSGARRLVSWNNTVFRDLSGNVVGTTSLGEDITERVQWEEVLSRRADEMARFHALTLELTSPGELQPVLESIVAGAVELVDASAGGLYLCDPDRREATCVVSYQTDQDFTGIILKYGEGAAGKVAETGEHLIIADYRTWEGRADVYRSEQSFQAVLSVPILWQERVEGVLHVLRYDEDLEFTQADLDLVTTLANHAAIAIENTRLLGQIQNHAADLEQRVAERTAELQERVDHVAFLNSGMVNLMADMQKARQRADKVADRLAALNKELEAFAYSVSHDLRAPLRGIAGFSAILNERHRHALDAQGREYLDYIIQASEHMEALIDDLLSYARLGRRALRIGPIDCKLLCQEIVNYHKDQIETHQIELVLPQTYPTVMADRTLLIQIFRNLIDNAIKYRRPEVTPVVELCWRAEPGYVLIGVRDNGLGIPAQHLEKVFTIFQRLHDSSDVTGTGIGLALVKKSVELLGGKVEVESVVGQGSTFWVRLPEVEK